MAIIALPNVLNIVENTKHSTDITNAEQIANTVLATIVAEDKTSSITGEWAIEATGITPIGGASPQFAVELEKRMNSKVFLPKYTRATTNKTDRFIATITGLSRNVKVFSGKATLTDRKEIYPKPATEYEAE